MEKPTKSKYMTWKTFIFTYQFPILSNIWNYNMIKMAMEYFRCQKKRIIKAMVSPIERNDGKHEHND